MLKASWRGDELGRNGTYRNPDYFDRSAATCWRVELHLSAQGRSCPPATRRFAGAPIGISAFRRKGPGRACRH